MGGPHEVFTMRKRATELRKLWTDRSVPGVFGFDRSGMEHPARGIREVGRIMITLDKNKITIYCAECAAVFELDYYPESCPACGANEDSLTPVSSEVEKGGGN